MNFRELWPKVVEAIERTMPLYDKVNSAISLGRDDFARRRAVEKSNLENGMSILDSGIGPGNLSKIVLGSTEPAVLVGLDFSENLLRLARENMSASQSLSLVRGVFEYIPFKDDVFDAILTSYALRDALDKESALKEYARVCVPKGLLAIVDIGKPDDSLKRWVMAFYMRYLMPLVAKAVILGRIKGNPWRLIVPTYENLGTNASVKELVETTFGETEMDEFLQGGIIVITSTNEKKYLQPQAPSR